MPAPVTIVSDPSATRPDRSTVRSAPSSMPTVNMFVVAFKVSTSMSWSSVPSELKGTDRVPFESVISKLPAFTAKAVFTSLVTLPSTSVAVIT